jgi:hypothetical protein
MTLNPYFLPKGHPDARVPLFKDGEVPNPNDPRAGVKAALVLERDTVGAAQWRSVGLADDDGSPMCLCDAPVSTFLNADETELPQVLMSGGDEYRYDILQARPYAANLGSAAQMVFRADNGSKTEWDPAKVTATGSGAYVSNGMSNQRNVFLTGYTDAASAAAYGLATASLQAPNAPGVYVNADQAGLTAALAAQTATSVDGVTTTDPASLPANAYPLTSVLYAAVDLTATDQAAREQYADLIEFAVTEGQVSGHSTGQLPEGYLPLTEGLREQALAAVLAIREYGPAEGNPSPSPSIPAPTPSATNSGYSPPPNGLNQNVPLATGATDVAANGAGRDGPALVGREPHPAYSQSQAIDAAATQGGGQPPATVALGVTLVVGVAGMVGGPLLLRRREVRP